MWPVTGHIPILATLSRWLAAVPVEWATSQTARVISSFNTPSLSKDSELLTITGITRNYLPVATGTATTSIAAAAGVATGAIT